MSGSDEWFITVMIVCTDRGRHPASKLRTVEFTPRRAQLTRAVDPFRSDGGERIAYVAGEGRKLSDAIEFQCPRCSRRPQVDANKLFRAAWEVQRAGGTRLDVSALS